MKYTEGIWLWLCGNFLILHWGKKNKKHFSLNIINHCICVFHWNIDGEAQKFLKALAHVHVLSALNANTH